MSWLTDIFSPKKQQAVQIPSLSSMPEYGLYKQTLEDRIAGRNIGYDPSVLSSATAPYATQQRQSFQNYTMPGISAQASARGLGRSTIPVSQGRLGSQEVESDIANRVAQLTLENEQEKAAEKTGAISQYGNLMGAEYTNKTGQAESAANAQNINNQAANANATFLRNLGIGGILSATTGDPGFLASGAGNQGMTLMDYYKLLNPGGSAGVNKT